MTPDHAARLARLRALEGYSPPCPRAICRPRRAPFAGLALIGACGLGFVALLIGAAHV